MNQTLEKNEIEFTEWLWNVNYKRLNICFIACIVLLIYLVYIDFFSTWFTKEELKVFIPVDAGLIIILAILASFYYLKLRNTEDIRIQKILIYSVILSITIWSFLVSIFDDNAITFMLAIITIYLIVSFELYIMIIILLSFTFVLMIFLFSNNNSPTTSGSSVIFLAPVIVMAIIFSRFMIYMQKKLFLYQQGLVDTFTSLSHEIKTPVTIISRYIEEYLDKYGSSKEIDIIKDNTDKLYRDITNFFTMEKFMKGDIQYEHNQIINLSGFIHGKIINFTPGSRRKNISLHSVIEEDIYIKADPYALDCLLNNLIENAIKYTPCGGFVKVLLNAEKKKIVLTIEDNGCGMPDDVQKNVFKPYYQASKVKGNKQGIGMGLAIVKHIIDSLNANITLTSKENEGAKFIVEFKPYFISPGDKVSEYGPDEPLRVNAEEKIEDMTANDNKPSLFIIEDHALLLCYLVNKLKSSYTIYVAENGKNALNKLKNIPVPDLILSDVMMDEMDGFDFVKTIKKIPVYENIPVIFLTAKSTTDDAKYGFDMGAIDYIKKPFDINILQKKIKAILDHSKKQQEAYLKSVKMAADQVMKGMLKTHTIPEDKFIRFDLSRREREVAGLLLKGHTSRQIGEKLYISCRTVENHAKKGHGSNWLIIVQ